MSSDIHVLRKTLFSYITFHHVLNSIFLTEYSVLIVDYLDINLSLLMVFKYETELQKRRSHCLVKFTFPIFLIVLVGFRKY